MIRKTLPYVPWIWYPLILGMALYLHFVLKTVDLPLIYSTYIPVLLAALSIILLEYVFPYRTTWKPSRAEVVNDCTFMVLVQVVLPQLLSLFIALELSAAISLGQTVWPRELPDAAQVLLMVLVADFLRYWLHRASHGLSPLWQLHAVHHSPHKLYWLNVGRFHPMEKAVQFLFDAMPFILLGVDETVLSLYFVFYAVNGYFQHCNINLRMGWLNYLISSAELHRWHHSVNHVEANRNYGNNIIIWDILFGTYFLPHNVQVGELGLKNRDYATRFVDQMKTPFIPHMENSGLPLISYRGIVINLVLKMRFLILYLSKWSKLMKATHSPEQAQLRVLNQIIKTNGQCRFGRDHHFDAIKGYRDYQNVIPIQSYDTLAQYINLNDETRCGLTSELPRFYQMTSGTTGSAKYLPLTKSGLQQAKSLQNMVALSRNLHNSRAYTGKLFAIVSPAIEGYLDSGIPFGSASGLTYQTMPAVARSKYVVPYSVFEIEDYDAKYFLIALYVLAEKRVTLAATANPSTMLRLIEIINEHHQQLIHIIETGKLSVPDFAGPLGDDVISGFKSDPKRAKELTTLVGDQGYLTYADVWPNLQQLIVWTGGSCGMTLSSLKKYLDPNTQICEMGYLASEVRATLTLNENVGLPTLKDNFFEFIERDDWEADRKTIRLLHELEVETQYYVIVTTVNGLYRYFMNDIVQVTGTFNNTPTLQFLQKGRGATNITGEKLYESQALEAIRILEDTHQLTVRFHQWLADEENACYMLYLEIDGGTEPDIEEFQVTLDEALAALNVEYQQKRSSGRLRAVVLKPLKVGTAEQFKKFHLVKGQREGQFKALTLMYLKDCSFPFSEQL